MHPLQLCPRLHGCGSEKEQLCLSKESSLLGETGVSKENGLAKERNNSPALGFGPFSPGSPPPVLWLWSPFSGTGQVLWFVVWTKPALVTPQCFTHGPAGLAQHRGLFLSTLCPHSECPGEVRDWGGHTQLTLSDQRIFHTSGHCSQQ